MVVQCGESIADESESMSASYGRNHNRIRKADLDCVAVKEVA